MKTVLIGFEGEKNNVEKGIKILLKYCELALVLLLALRSDIKTYKIKNQLTLFFMFVGVMTNSYLQGIVGFWDSLLGITVPVILLLVLFKLRMLGAGDIKLFSSIGAIMGRKFVLETLVYTALAGGILAVIIMIVKKNGTRRWRYLMTYLKYVLLTHFIPSYREFSIMGKEEVVPFSCSIVMGVLVKIILTK